MTVGMDFSSAESLKQPAKQAAAYSLGRQPQESG